MTVDPEPLYASVKNNDHQQHGVAHTTPPDVAVIEDNQSSTAAPLVHATVDEADLDMELRQYDTIPDIPVHGYSTTPSVDATEDEDDYGQHEMELMQNQAYDATHGPDISVQGQPQNMELVQNQAYDTTPDIPVEVNESYASVNLLEGNKNIVNTYQQIVEEDYI